MLYLLKKPKLSIV